MKPNIHIGEEIRKELITQKRSVNWLAEEIGYDQSHLCKRLNKQHFSIDLLCSISIALGKDFFATYSNLLSNHFFTKNK